MTLVNSVLPWESTLFFLHNRLSSTICISVELIFYWKKQKLQEMCHAGHTTEIWQLFHLALPLMWTWWICWHSEDTQVVYVCVESSQTKLCLCMRTQPHWGRARLSQRNPWISIRNRCSFFFFFHCITLVIQHKLFSGLPSFKQVPI